MNFSLPADQVAPLLLGCVLHHRTAAGEVAVRLTEVEAYLGKDDPAAHSYRGPTPRTEPMFGPGGRMYVYLSYGIHLAGNLTCGPVGTGHAVLLRAGSVEVGAELARRRRLAGRSPGGRRDAAARFGRRGCASGPGNLGKAMGFSLVDNHAEVHGADRADQPGAFWLTGAGPAGTVERGPRVGITKNAEAPLRFWLAGEPTVSRGPAARVRGG